jgi:hypothetical protein
VIPTKSARGWTRFRRSFARYAHLFALAMVGVAALFGIPLVLDPPPGDRVEEAHEKSRKSRSGDKRRRR